MRAANTMNTILPLASELKPVSIHAYFDKVVVWLRYRVNNAELAWLRRYCGRIRKSGVKTKGGFIALIVGHGSIGATFSGSPFASHSAGCCNGLRPVRMV